MRYSHIIKNSFVDGPGRRTTLFLQGCPLACHGCQNKALWPADGGANISAWELAEQVMAHGNLNITISGGEPTEQISDLRILVNCLRGLGAKHVIIYSGRTWEWLLENRSFDFANLLQSIDILVDGPYIADQDDSLLVWRGSRNQRIIDCQATLRAGGLVMLDWSQPEIQIDADGSLHLPIGLVEDFSEIGKVARSRRCGQT